MNDRAPPSGQPRPRRRLPMPGLVCRDAARLLSEECEHRLPRWQWLLLRIHLLICGACRRYAHQLRWIREAARRKALDEAARKHLHRSLDTREP